MRPFDDDDATIRHHWWRSQERSQRFALDVTPAKYLEIEVARCRIDGDVDQLTHRLLLEVVLGAVKVIDRIEDARLHCGAKRFLSGGGGGGGHAHTI